MSNATPRISTTAGTLLILVLAAALALFAGCADDENGPACESYVMTLNALECLPDGADLAEDWCTSNHYDVYPCDVASYFTCQESSVSCDGSTFVDDRGDCGVPVCN